MLTKESFNTAVDNYQNEHDSDGRFGENTTKTKYYEYLSYCVTKYRKGKKKPLKDVLRFLQSSRNKQYLASQLMDAPTQSPDKCWSVGEHEWLLRSLIVDVLMRSAGMVKDVQSHISYCMLEDYSWLDVQCDLRTPTDAILFRTEDRVIRTGHKGAVKATPNTSPSGSRTAGSPGFHDLLIAAFNRSKSIDGFLKRVDNIAKTQIFTGKNELNPDEVNTNYLSSGAATNSKRQINKFRNNYLKIKIGESRETLFSARQLCQGFES